VLEGANNRLLRSLRSWEDHLDRLLLKGIRELMDRALLIVQELTRKRPRPGPAEQNFMGENPFREERRAGDYDSSAGSPDVLLHADGTLLAYEAAHNPYKPIYLPQTMDNVGAALRNLGPAWPLANLPKKLSAPPTFKGRARLLAGRRTIGGIGASSTGQRHGPPGAGPYRIQRLRSCAGMRALPPQLTCEAQQEIRKPVPVMPLRLFGSMLTFPYRIPALPWTVEPSALSIACCHPPPCPHKT
jgi:hypothetical protein